MQFSLNELEFLITFHMKKNCIFGTIVGAGAF